jgi:dihydroorotase
MKNSEILFQNVRVIDPNSPHHLKMADVHVKNGILVAIEAPGTISDAGIPQSVQGGCISPGWIDMRVHLTVPGFENKEDLVHLASAAVAGGFTGLVCLPNTNPSMDHAGQIRSLLLQAAGLPCAILPVGCVSLGAKGSELAELYDMHNAGAVAFSDGINSLQSSGLLMRALQYTIPFGAVVLDYPFDASLAGGAEVGEGVHATEVGMKGIPALAEEMGVLRSIKIFAHDPHKLHLGPLTTSRAVEALTNQKGLLSGLTLETSSLYLLLDDSRLLDFDVNAKIWPPLRTSRDVMALREAIRAGLIDVISSSHHPQGHEDKAHDFADAAFGASTLETTFSVARTALDRLEDVEVLVRAMAIRPREILSLIPSVINIDSKADLTWFDPDVDWTPSLADLKSKGKNNPILGMKLKGRALGTVFNGQFRNS